ncbi:MAG: ShlB/FhaC/HecB family hemolysin secretion/activation protein [Burkholderiaceae bacterium]|nr:ShlB/FhaC/HecB family hemolysin secretion/activation protein [Burkholderiaceae bacterium]
MKRRGIVKKLPMAAMATLIAAVAQVSEAQQVPNAGSLLQQNQPPKPPTASPAGTGLTIEQNNGATAPPTAPFPVSRIEISGNTKFDSATLHALVADAEGKSLTLAQLGEVANRITTYYRDHGFPLARAVVPAQTVKNGVVQLLVVEARYGKIKLDNHSRVDDGLLASTLAPLQSGQPIEQGGLDHGLLLLTDVPGTNINATLKPGDSVGTSDLVVDAANAAAVTGSVAADNYGNRYTSRARLGGTLNVFDPLHHGDVLSLSALTTGSDMNTGRIGYDVLLNGAGTHLGASYSALHYKLGDTLSALGGHGNADVASLWAKHPFIRTPKANLYGQIEYDHKKISDDIDATGIDTDRHLDNWTLSLLGDCRDASGTNSWNLALTEGNLKFDNAAAEAADAATAKTKGSFSKWIASANRVQELNPGNSLYFALSGQWSNTNLDASEKMVAGGAYTVRAYDMGVLSGDSGVLGNIEWRHDFGRLGAGQAQAIVFFDSEHITVNQSAWASGSNSATLSGAGVGFNWFGPAWFSIKSTVATPVGATPDLLGGKSKSLRGWIEFDIAM